MSEPTAWVICSPTADHAPSVKGSTREYCGICAEEVWVSPSSKAVAPPGHAYLCTDCAPGVIATDDDPQFMRPTAEQLAEIRQVPACPGCGARATWHGPNDLVDNDHWETEHSRDCPWMADQASRPY